MPLLDNIEFLNRGNGTTFIDVANGDAAGTNVEAMKELKTRVEYLEARQ